MKAVKVSFVILVAALLAAGLGTTAFAFHSGGVAECGGCHSMHTPKAGGSFLLLGTDQSSTCLNCHLHPGDTGPTSYHIATADANMPAGTAPLQRTPGGDFGWLKKTYTFTVRGTVNTETGSSHGHNIISADYGYGVDPDFASSPGGTFPSSQLACNSCHDPHGKYRRLSTGSVATSGAPIVGSGSYDTSATPAVGQAVGVYRLLAGAGYAKGGVTFGGVPVAVAPSTYNRSESLQQTRVAYGVSTTGGQEPWGQWCGTCHGSMHSTGNYVHPVDQGLGSSISTRYSQYVSSGIMTGTFAAGQGPFLSLVPFAENTGDYTVLKSHAKNNGTALAGPGTSDQVMCLSCHRAHASGFPEMLRWQMEGEFISYVDNTGAAAWPGTDTTPGSPQFARGRLAAENQAAYYDRPVSVFGAYQRVLCNKCHAQD